MSSNNSQYNGYLKLDNGDIYVEEENHGRLLMGTEKGELKWESQLQSRQIASMVEERIDC